MKFLLWNVFLALAWVAVTGSLTAANLAAGFALGYSTLWVTTSGPGKATYFSKLKHVVKFASFLGYDLVVSALQVAWNVLTPKSGIRPGVIAIPIELKTAAEIVILANSITLTPGTLTLDISEDKKTLFVHAIFIDDPARFRAEIRDGIEKRTAELMK